VTRNSEPGSFRNLIGLKVSDDMFEAIELARGVQSVPDFLRALISTALQQHAVISVNWEQRARKAEQRLERVREALD